MSGRRRLAAIVGLGLVAAAVTLTGAQTPPATAARPAPSRPRLLVLLVVDQFRADYVDWYGGEWTSGLKRLVTDGAFFPRATVPYGITKTCAGHATIGTGTWPAVHGLIDNDWYDSRARSTVPCTLDEGARSIGFGGPGIERHGPARLLAPTLAEELRRQASTPPRIVAMALKARAAISLSGRGGPGTIVFWEEDSGLWATSSAFASTPWPEVAELIAERPTQSARGQLWNRLLAPNRYRFDDRAPGEPSAGTFPHVLRTPIGTPFAAVWDMSPLADAYLAELGASLTSKVGLGQRNTTDLLAIGFSALDYVGHAYGPRSHEVQDMLIRLDVVLGRMFDALDASVGKDRYTVALTSDHGVALLPEQADLAEGNGRLTLTPLGVAIESALASHFNRRAFIEAITGSYVHFLPGVLDEIRANPAAVRAVQAAAEGAPGVERVFWSWDLSSNAPTTDPRLSAMRRSYVAGRSGDLAFQPEPNWVVASAGTNHGSWHPYDTTVPLAFMGAGIKPGRYTSDATLADVAPTLGATAGVSMPRATGRILKDVLAD